MKRTYSTGGYCPFGTICVASIFQASEYFSFHTIALNLLLGQLRTVLHVVLAFEMGFHSTILPNCHPQTLVTLQRVNNCLRQSHVFKVIKSIYARIMRQNIFLKNKANRFTCFNSISFLLKFIECNVEYEVFRHSLCRLLSLRLCAPINHNKWRFRKINTNLTKTQDGRKRFQFKIIRAEN